MTIDDVQITLTIKRQCCWAVKLIWCVAFSVSANNNSALLCSFWPTHNTMIVTICYIDCTWCIDEETIEDKTTVSKHFLFLVLQPQQYLLSHLYSISSHDDCIDQTHTLLVLHRRRDKSGSWVDSIDCLVHFHQLQRCHSSLQLYIVELHGFRCQRHRDISDDRWLILYNRCCQRLLHLVSCLDVETIERTRRFNRSAMKRLFVSLSMRTSVGQFNWSNRFPSPRPPAITFPWLAPIFHSTMRSFQQSAMTILWLSSSMSNPCGQQSWLRALPSPFPPATVTPFCDHRAFVGRVSMSTMKEKWLCLYLEYIFIYGERRCPLSK